MQSPEKLVPLNLESGGNNSVGEVNAMPGKNIGEHKYGSEVIRLEIGQEAARIREWAAKQGYEEGQDYRIIEDIKDVLTEGEQVAPHEQKSYYMAIHEDHYGSFRDYFIGDYEKARQQENPDAKVHLNYSWGGRFLVDSDTVPCDTAPVADLETLTVPTKHGEFRQFFRERTDTDFPSAEQLNPILKEMSDKGLDYYRNALAKMRELVDTETLPNDAYGLMDDVEHKIIVLENAQKGDALIELPETLHGRMDPKMRHYADFTYNADDMRSLDRVTEVTGIIIPNDARTDKILEKFGIDRQQMEDICKEFSQQRFQKGQS